MDYVFDTNSVLKNNTIFVGPSDRGEPESPQSSIQKEFDNKKNTHSDINEHMDTLAKYASHCGHITEMGVRSVVSTWAFLSAKPKRLVSIDINPAPIENAMTLAALNGIDMDFIIGDTVDPNFEIEETDLLFIDTWHVYRQLKKELKQHSHKARKYMIFHDTTTFGHVDEGENPISHTFSQHARDAEVEKQGLFTAIEEFLEENDEWYITEKFANNNGLTVLCRKPCVHIYQSYYKEEQIKVLNSIFTPFNNINGDNPELREYIIWNKLYNKHIDDGSYFGLVSWIWNQKVNLSEEKFRNWIVDNSGYDVYFVDPTLDNAANEINLWVQGDRWHPGLLDFAKKIFPKVGIETPVEEIVYKGDHFATSNFFVGNSRFWFKYKKFVDNFITTAHGDSELRKYMFEDLNTYNGKQIPNFSFIVERLFSLYLFLNPDNISYKKFPITDDSYKLKYGDLHEEYVKLYNEKN
jgi:hypothetical protein